MSPSVLPAFLTKHLQTLEYPFNNSLFCLSQLADGRSNGTTLWLGAQCLSFMLLDIQHKFATFARQDHRTPRAIELGSGIGLTSLALCSLGWDVVATDVPGVISTVLLQNIAQNSACLSSSTSGRIEIRELDWTVIPDEWIWDNDKVIASAATHPGDSSPSQGLLGPPFDLILSSDTLYSPDLTQPLLRTLHALSAFSLRGSRPPPIYLCIERRDPVMVDRALEDARNIWGFIVERVSHRKVTKMMDKSGVKWAKDDWEGVEIWKLVLAQRVKEDITVT